MNALRAAGQNTAALAGALAAMELTPADGATIELAKDMARKLDSTPDERLAVRYSAHYAQLVKDLNRRSDANRARREAEEKRQREEEEKRQQQRHNPLREMRHRHIRDGRGAEDPAELARTRARVRRQARSGMTLREISLRMGGVAEQYPYGLLTPAQQKQLGPPAPPGGMDLGALTGAERKLLERHDREEEAQHRRPGA